MNARPTLSGRIAVVCAYCHDTYGQKPALPEQDGLVSHGICPACFPAALAGIEREIVFRCAPSLSSAGPRQNPRHLAGDAARREAAGECRGPAENYFSP